MSLFLSTYLVPHSQIWFHNHNRMTTYRRESSPPKKGSTESENPGSFKEKPIHTKILADPFAKYSSTCTIVGSLLKSKYGLKKSPL